MSVDHICEHGPECLVMVILQVPEHLVAEQLHALQQQQQQQQQPVSHESMLMHHVAQQEA